MRTSLAAAVVANTLLRRPESTRTATEFYDSTLREACSRHHRWATTHYCAVAAGRPTSFWTDRARGALPDGPSTAPASWPMSAIVRLSPLARFVDRPCIQGEFVVPATAIDHPDLDSPLAFLGSRELAPLLRRIRPRMTANDVACAWADSMPLQSALTMVAWLLDHRILLVDRETAHRPTAFV
jgi:hypothetical protein